MRWWCGSAGGRGRGGTAVVMVRGAWCTVWDAWCMVAVVRWGAQGRYRLRVHTFDGWRGGMPASPTLSPAQTAWTRSTASDCPVVGAGLTKHNSHSSSSGAMIPTTPAASHHGSHGHGSKGQTRRRWLGGPTMLKPSVLCGTLPLPEAALPTAPAAPPAPRPVPSLVRPLPTLPAPRPVDISDNPFDKLPSGRVTPPIPPSWRAAVNAPCSPSRREVHTLSEAAASSESPTGSPG